MARKPKTAAIDAALAKRQQRASALFDATVKNIPDLVRGAGPGALDTLGRAYGVGRDYVQSRTPQQVAGDVAKGLGAVGDATARYAKDRTQNPLKVLGDAYGVGKDILTGVPQAVSDVAHMSERAQALKATDPAAARRMQAGIAMAAMGVMPGVRTGKKVAKAVGEAEKLAEKYGTDLPKVHVDNPGGEWLVSKQRYAEEDMVKAAKAGYAPGAPRGPMTGYLDKPMLLDPAKVGKLPGAMGEVPKPGNPKYDALMKSMSKKGYDPEQGGAILVGVNHRGEPHIIEGNNRAAVARDLGLPAIPAEVRWYAGGEQAPGALSPDKLADYAYRPAPAAEKLAEKAAPAVVGRASPADEVLRLRAAQLKIPNQKDRLQPSGYQVFKTTPEAYDRTPLWVPQTPREKVQALQPRHLEGVEYPLNGRIQPLIDDRGALSQFIANHIEDVDSNLPASRFYHTGPIYEGLAEAGGLGPEGAKTYMNDWFRPSFAGSSPRTPTPQNLRNSTLLNYLKAKGEDISGYYERKGNIKGYPMMGDHYDLTDRFSKGTADIDKNPKPYGYGYASIGDLNHVAADTHNIRATLMLYDRMNPGGVPKEWFKTPEAWEAYQGGEGFNVAMNIDDSLKSAMIGGRKAQVEYGPMTDISHDVGRILDIPSSTSQARVWFKEGEHTNLKSPPKTITDLKNDAIDITAQGLGITPEEVLRLMAKHETMLMAKGGLAEKYGL